MIGISYLLRLLRPTKYSLRTAGHASSQAEYDNVCRTITCKYKPDDTTLAVVEIISKLVIHFVRRECRSKRNRHLDLEILSLRLQNGIYLLGILDRGSALIRILIW